MSIRNINTEYEDYLENINEPAPSSVKKAYSAFHKAFNDYISEVSEFEWKRGFNHALRLLEKEDC